MSKPVIHTLLKHVERSPTYSSYLTVVGLQRKKNKGLTLPSLQLLLNWWHKPHVFRKVSQTGKQLYQHVDRQHQRCVLLISTLTNAVRMWIFLPHIIIICHVRIGYLVTVTWFLVTLYSYPKTLGLMALTWTPQNSVPQCLVSSSHFLCALRNLHDSTTDRLISQWPPIWHWYEFIKHTCDWVAE